MRFNESWKQYDKITPWFDAHRSKDLMEREYLEFAVQHIPKKGSILDLGCGTGEPLAQFFINRGSHVTGVDAAPQMIALCKKRFPEMDWIVADMRTIDLDKKFNALIAWDSFFHLTQDEQRSMFPIFSKHLKERGILIFTTGPRRGEVYSTMGGYDFYHASLSLDEYRNLLTQYGFEILLNKVEDPKCGMHTVWIAQKTEKNE